MDRRSIQQDAGVREGGGEVIHIHQWAADDVFGWVVCRCGAFADSIHLLNQRESQAASKDARIAHLEALIADAPHSKDCPRSSKHSSFLSCNCFKSRALDTGSKG